jgi:hypothetical protein
MLSIDHAVTVRVNRLYKYDDTTARDGVRTQVRSPVPQIPTFREENMQLFQASIRFECPTCKKTADMDITVPEPDWSAERFSDMGSEEQTEIECPHCKSEYAAYIYNHVHSSEVSFTDFPETIVVADTPYYSPPEEDDSWIDYNIPDNPYSVFEDTYQHMSDILADHGGGGEHMINRMVFVQQVNAFEAYLADKLIKTALADEEEIARLIADDSELAKQKFSLAEIAAEANFVKLKVRSHLKSIVYHNLARVQPLYNMVFGLDLFELLGESAKEKMFAAIEYRHDCIHRNGYDKDGRKLDVFTKEYVRTIAGEMKRLIDKVERKSNLLDEWRADLDILF